MNIKLILNPGSRSGRGRRLWRIWEAGLRQSGIVYDSVITRGLGDAFRASKESHGADVIIAAGGDGTINEVLDGIMQSGNPAVRMGVLYAGTSPDFCRYHGIPTDPHQALQRILDGNARPIDVVRIVYADANHAMRIAHFACGCNIGMGASVARFANRWRRYLGDGLGTGLGVVRAFLYARPVDLVLEIDGVKTTLAQVNNLSILKNPYIASGLKLNVNLRADDGRMMLVGVHGQSRTGLCRLLPGFYSGNAVDEQAVFIRECARVNIRAKGTPEIEFDGDPRGYLPAELQVLPRALNLIGGCHD